MATKTPETKAILMAPTRCRGLGRQSDTNRLMRSSARSRVVFSGSTCLPLSARSMLSHRTQGEPFAYPPGRISMQHRYMLCRTKHP
jgi:hypothetical protein